MLVQALTRQATPHALLGFGPDNTVPAFEQEEDLLNAPFGTFAKQTLAASTFALESTDDTVYNTIETEIQNLTGERNTLATQMKDELYEAAVDGHPIDDHLAQQQIAQAKDLIAQAAALPSG